MQILAFWLAVITIAKPADATYVNVVHTYHAAFKRCTDATHEMSQSRMKSMEAVSVCKALVQYFSREGSAAKTKGAQCLALL